MLKQRAIEDEAIRSDLAAELWEVRDVLGDTANRLAVAEGERDSLKERVADGRAGAARLAEEMVNFSVLVGDGFRVGDPVKREIDVHNPERGWKRGVVIERYAERDYFGYYEPELYAVRFKDGTEHRGYLRHGLTPDTVKP